MKSTILIIKNIISPLALFFFLLLGVVAAALSGIIEYAVIKEMFIIEIGGTSYSFFIPLVVVVVLEGFKLFLHFAIPAHKNNDTKNLKLISKQIVKSILVVFSLICTFIFTCNSMYDFDAVSNATRLNTTAIEEKYNKDVEEIKQKMADDKKDILNEKISEIDKIESNITNKENAINNLDPMNPNYDSAYKNMSKDLKGLKDDLKDARDEYDSTVLTINNTLNQKYQPDLDELKTTMQKDIAAVEAKQTLDSSGDNPYIRAALNFFVSTFSGESKEYSRAFYYFIVFTISLMVAIMLEIVISTSQSYIAKKSDELVALFGSNEPINENLKKRAERISKILKQAAIMLSFFLILGVISEHFSNELVNGVFDKKNLFFAFVSYVFSIACTAGKLSFKDETGSNDKGVVGFFKTTTGFIVSIIIQTLLCIIGFISLGVVFGGTAEAMVPTTLALSIGSVSGQVLLSPAKAFSI